MFVQTRTEDKSDLSLEGGAEAMDLNRKFFVTRVIEYQNGGALNRE